MAIDGRYGWRQGRVRRAVVSRSRAGGVMTDTLECGHQMVSRRATRHRYCPACGQGRPAVALPALNPVGETLLRMLPPPGRPFPPERRAAYLTTARALIEDVWGERDGQTDAP